MIKSVSDIYNVGTFADPRGLTEKVIDPPDFQCPVEQVLDSPEPVPGPHDHLERESELDRA